MDKMVCSNTDTNTSTSTCCIAIILGAVTDCDTHRGTGNINLYGNTYGTFNQ